MKVYDIQVKYKAVKTLKEEKLTAPKEVFKYMNGAFDNAPMQEHFYIILMNSNNEPMGRYMCTLGLVNQCSVHPREVFKMAVQLSATSIILVHNHPSGNLTPSQEDIQVTKKLCEAGKILDIPVLDHIIITDESFYSIRGSLPSIFT